MNAMPDGERNTSQKTKRRDLTCHLEMACGKDYDHSGERQQGDGVSCTAWYRAGNTRQEA